MKDRSWRWLRTRILGLLSRPSQIDEYGQTVFPNRIQEQLFTPPAEPAQQRAYQ